MISCTAAQLSLLAPNAHTVYRKALASADTVLATYGINDSALRLAHFMAQVLEETGGLTVLRENLNYRAERLLVVWPSRFHTLAAAQPFAHNPEALANNVYGGRMKNTKPGDGWKFIGRGMLQITGRESYENIGGQLGIKLADNPDLAIDPSWTLKIAAQEWSNSNCNKLADKDKLGEVTKAINGGYIGLAERGEWLVKTKHVWS